MLRRYAFAAMLRFCRFLRIDAICAMPPLFRYCCHALRGATPCYAALRVAR